MVRTIKIGYKSYDLKASAYTMFLYKDKTGRNLLEDIGYINEKYNAIIKLQEDEQSNAWLGELTGIIEKILKLAHLMIQEQNPSFKSYEEWLKELDYLMDDTSWIMEVLEVGISPFCGRVSNSEK